MIINWLQNKYYEHQYLKFIPNDYTSDSIVLDNNNFIIRVYGREGRVPRFHILDNNGNEVCSISLVKPKYIGKPNRYLNNKELEDLDKWMNKKSIDKNCSNWIIFCGFWECACFNHEFRYDKMDIPDYTLLRKEK